MTVDEYPFGGESRVSEYAMVYVAEISSYLLVGGCCVWMSQIAVFTNGAWYDAGQLNSARGVSVSSFVCS